MFNFWWSARLVDGLKPRLPPLSSQKNKRLIFTLCSTSDDRSGWSMDSNPVYHPSPAKKMKCLFLDYVQLLMISQASQWTRTHLPPISSQKNKMLVFGLRSTSDDWLGWSMDLNPSATRLQPKKWNAHFWITFNFWWSAGLVNGLKPHLPPLSSQINKMLIFGLHSTSDDRSGWSMDLNPVCQPSPAKKIKCLILGYVQLLMIGWAGVMDLNPICHPSPAKKNKMLIFGLHSTSDDQLGWSMDSNPICHPSPAKKIKWSSLDYVQLLMIG